MPIRNTLPLLAFGLLASWSVQAQTVDVSAAKAANKIEFTPDMLIGPCPVERLRKAYKSLLQEEDTFNLSAVDQQVILICTERQKLVNGYIESLQKTAGLLEGLSRLSHVAQTDQPNGVTLEDVASASSSPALKAVTQSTTPEPKSEPILEGATPKQAVSKAAISKPEEGFLTGTNGCSARYTLLGTGAKDGKPYAIIADEIRDQTLNVFVGQEMPLGVTLLSIDDLTVKVEDTIGEHVLPFTSPDWVPLDSGWNSGTDGLVSFKLNNEGGEIKRTPIEIKVFEGYTYD